MRLQKLVSDDARLDWNYHDMPHVRIKILKSSKGRDISGINQMEQEILYERGFKFKVVGISKENGIVYIQLQEA